MASLSRRVERMKQFVLRYVLMGVGTCRNLTPVRGANFLEEAGSGPVHASANLAQ
jgi:hypothetical protein